MNFMSIIVNFFKVDTKYLEFLKNWEMKILVSCLQYYSVEFLKQNVSHPWSVFPLWLNTWKSGPIFWGVFLDILNFHKSKANKKMILKCYKDTWHGVPKKSIVGKFYFWKWRFDCWKSDRIYYSSTCWTIIFNKFVVLYIRFSPFSKAPHNPKKWTNIY